MNSYRDSDGDDQGREIEHLILVTHGIGQRLGLRMESINFIHDVNVLRKTLKSVYDSSPDLQALNNEVEKLPKNCRVQVLPVVWRHLLDFPKQSFKQNSKEKDLTEVCLYMINCLTMQFERTTFEPLSPKRLDLQLNFTPSVEKLTLVSSIGRYLR